MGATCLAPPPKKKNYLAFLKQGGLFEPEETRLFKLGHENILFDTHQALTESLV